MMDKQQLLFVGIENALDYLHDIISGVTFGKLDDSQNGKDGRRAGLSQVEMIRSAINTLKDENKGENT